MSSTSDLDASRYLAALKEILKERGVTYAQLARSLRCSLPTVKRALNRPSISFSRLIELCEVAEIPFEDLHERAGKRRPKHHVLTDEQDRLFFERPELLDYLMALASEGATPSAIARRNKLDRRSTGLYLKHLARVGLVEVEGPDQIRLRAQPPFGVGPQSRWFRAHQERFMKSVVARVLNADPPNHKCVAVLKPLILIEDDYSRMIVELEAVIHRFSAVSERSLGRGKSSQWQVAIACGPRQDVEPRRLPRITN